MAGGYAITNRGQDALIAWLIAEPTMRGVELSMRYGHGVRELILGNDLPGTVEALIIESVTRGAVPVALWEIPIEDDGCPLSSSQGGGAPPPMPASDPAGTISAPSPALAPLPAYLGERAIGPIVAVDRIGAVDRVVAGGWALRFSGVALALDDATADAACVALAAKLGRSLGARL
ncbi:hypothetical protein [Sphingomonas montanisoli]|uniref:Uncharacterized protein n=1 Tax=Sphingomonas montanisoli TaxID=2606412 RepID=A0A5D9C5G9_9SPHN|nr:hypothetical protein [Sphingomonas montanisoli]TZG26487.1 hypothetical protein FYJ91_16315 [Sphingomonas montanisoli]